MTWMDILAIALIAVTSVVIGMLWYSKLMFAEPWMKSLDMKESVLSDSGKAMAQGTISNFVGAVGFFVLISQFGEDSLARIMWMVFALWVIVAAAKFIQVVFNKEVGTSKRFKEWLITSGNLLVYFIISGLIIYWF